MVRAWHTGHISAIGLLVLLTAAVVTSAHGQVSRVDQARAFFERFVALGNAGDVAVADLYADDAKIVGHRTYPTGKTRRMAFTGRRWKEMLRKIMPLARATNDRSSFSDMRYALEGGRVRITATRYSERKRYSAPYSSLVGPNGAGEWRIYEETVHTRP